MIKKLLSSFSSFVFSGIILGLLTGGYPGSTSEIAMGALIIAMTFSLMPISFTSFSFQKGSRNITVSLLLNFGLLSSLILLLSSLFPDEIAKGFVVMAAVPTAIVVLPLTTLLKGDVKYTLLSLSSIYLASFILTPLFILVFLQKEVNAMTLFRDILLLIAFPLVLSRIIRRIDIPSWLPRTVANICFFLLVFDVIGKNRMFLFHNIETVSLISLALIVRTFGTGMIVRWLGIRKGMTKEEIIPFSLFASFKNEGMAILLSLSLFPSDVAYTAAVPAVVGIILELIWACCLEAKVM
ncbi:MAG TPA: hypothetical protein EYP23_04115 [Thermoplasmata archaeon]|nr:hypothetical protein [Thermoplasmata archaeon]